MNQVIIFVDDFCFSPSFHKGLFFLCGLLPRPCCVTFVVDETAGSLHLVHHLSGFIRECLGKKRDRSVCKKMFCGKCYLYYEVFSVLCYFILCSLTIRCQISKELIFMTFRLKENKNFILHIYYKIYFEHISQGGGVQ